MKFKVGDKVRVKNGLKIGEYGEKNLYCSEYMLQCTGKTLTIKALDTKSLDYLVEENEWYWNDEMLEPVTPQFTKQDLKAGMVVEAKGGTFWFVVNSRTGLNALQIIDGKLESCQIPFDEAINDDLTYKYNGYNPSGDIVRVFDMPEYGWQTMDFVWFRKEQPIWERKVLKKITKEELAEMGYELIKGE